GDCGVPAATLGSPAAASGPQAHDTKAPSARISGIRDGARYRRGPRVLRGVATDDTGVSTVKLALRRHVKGRPCRWWSGRRELVLLAATATGAWNVRARREGVRPRSQP